MALACVISLTCFSFVRRLSSQWLWLFGSWLMPSFVKHGCHSFVGRRGRVAANLCECTGFGGGLDFDFLVSQQLPSSSHVQERDEVLVCAMLTRRVWEKNVNCQYGEQDGDWCLCMECSLTLFTFGESPLFSWHCWLLGASWRALCQVVANKLESLDEEWDEQMGILCFLRRQQLPSSSHCRERDMRCCSVSC